jgi:hypothetical protein
MSVVTPCPTGSAAERARSIVAAACSSTVRTPEGRVELFTDHGVDGGRLCLRAGAEGPLVTEIDRAEYGDLPAVVELTDLAPVSVPDRIRARVAVTGWLTLTGRPDPAGRVPVHCEPAEIQLITADGCVDVTPEEFAAARPDPLAAAEAEMLTHLCDSHPEAVTALSRLIAPRLLQGAVRVQPYRLDRYGVVLRVERTGGRYRDTRLAFIRPLQGVDDLTGALSALLARAQQCRRARLFHEA